MTAELTITYFCIVHTACERNGSSRISTRRSDPFQWLPLPAPFSNPRPPTLTQVNFFTPDHRTAPAHQIFGPVRSNVSGSKVKSEQIFIQRVSLSMFISYHGPLIGIRKQNRPIGIRIPVNNLFLTSGWNRLCRALRSLSSITFERDLSRQFRPLTATRSMTHRHRSTPAPSISRPPALLRSHSGDMLCVTCFVWYTYRRHVVACRCVCLLQKMVWLTQINPVLYVYYVPQAISLSLFVVVHMKTCETR